MDNITTEVVGNILTLKIDLSKELGLSGSGKTILVASTKGNKAVPGTDCTLGLNFYKYPKR
jgi:hypothetical protein